MTVTAPETELRNRILAALNTEFSSDNITFISDKLHPSLGLNGAVGGVYPGNAEESFSNGLVLSATCYVQLYLPWTAQVDPKMTVDPTAIENMAERVRRTCLADDVAFAGSTQLWFYRVTRVEYPPDPTGNISRLQATVLAASQNSALTETTG